MQTDDTSLCIARGLSCCFANDTAGKESETRQFAVLWFCAVSGRYVGR